MYTVLSNFDINFSSGNGNSNGLFSVLIRDYNTYAAAFCMNRLAKLRYFICLCFIFSCFFMKVAIVSSWF